MEPYNSTQIKALTEYMSEFVTDERKQRFNEVLGNRIDHMQVVLEDVYQAHNASAVIRSADCFGIQHVHFIEDRNRYKISGDVALGASQWLNIHRYKSSKEAVKELKAKGLKIVATTPHTKAQTIYNLDVKEKFALVFGTEKEGITGDIKEMADEFVMIPMHGFTESFNVSVCAALCMHELSRKIRQEVKTSFLSEEERAEIYLNWLIKSVKKGDRIATNFLNKNPSLSAK